MDAGELVPDEIVVGVVEECLAPGGPLDDGFVLDGFPRTLHQAQRARPRARRPPARRRDQPRRAARDRARPPRRPAGLRELPARVPREHAADVRLDVRHVRRRRRAARRRHRGGDRPPARALRAARRCRSSTTTATGAARGGRRGRRGRRGLRPPREGRSTTAMPDDTDPMVLRKTPPRSRTCGEAGSVVAEMHEECIRAAKPGATTADLDRAAREVLDRAARPLELPRLPRVPGGGLHLAERGDRARHPRRPRRLDDGDIVSIDCGAIIEGWHADAAITVPVGDDRRRVPAPDRRDPGVARGRDRGRSQVGNRLGDIGAAVRGRRHRRPGSPSCGSTSATASAPPCTRSPTCPTTDPPGRGLRLRAGHGARDRADGQRGHAPRPGSSTTAGRRDRRRLPLRALRAHRRPHRRRPRGPDPCR